MTDPRGGAGREGSPPSGLATETAETPEDTGTGRWPARLAVITAALTLVLIVSGGVVTSREAGMAVPDWPTTYGHNMFTYPWSAMVGDIFYEHGHRLLGTLVGITTILMCVTLLLGRAPVSVKYLGALAVVGVSVQGVLGGLRVTESSVTLAIVHGCTAQAFFGLLAVIIALTRRRPLARLRRDDDPKDPGARKLGFVAIALAGLIYLQVISGAVTRHLGEQLAGAVHLHLLMAFVVVAGVILVAIAVSDALSRQKDGDAWRSDVAGATMLLGGALCAQVVLGVGAWSMTAKARLSAIEPPLEVAFTAAHVAVGAILLATALFLAVRLRIEPAPAPALGPTGGDGGAACDGAPSSAAASEIAPDAGTPARAGGLDASPSARVAMGVA